MIKRLWSLFSYGLTGYTVYKQLTSAAVAKDELYDTLTPAQQEEWKHVFGTPDIAVSSPQLPPVARRKPADITQVAAGI